MLHHFGIRHHGPGSARSLLEALEALAPDCLVIEAPADAEQMAVGSLQLAVGDEQSAVSVDSNEASLPIADCRLQTANCPLALLIYDPKDFSRASYLPFADFSPEWQAMQFALSKNIPLRFMDLPMEMSFALDETERKNPQTALDIIAKLSPEERRFRHDPMGTLAALAGYSDSERWWEVMFENVENPTDIFGSLLEMTTALREGAVYEDARTLQREAHMRQVIRKAEKEGFQNIAIVCGAWHLPALHNLQRFKANADAALLKGIKKVKTATTWIPWSYERLTFESGYRAGVISPAWYELLFQNRKSAATHWMVRVARLFRNEDLDASSAHVIEAIRLAETLATMRGLQVPGIDELKEAAISCICEGDQAKLQLIEHKLIVGDKVGSVPDNIPVVPLQKDVEQAIKSARLTKYWEVPGEEWLGATAAAPQGGIDLREDSGKLKSQLLHRLHLLGIPWGRQMEVNRHASAGGFKEHWKMKWLPDFAIKIIEMGAWGNTIEEACTQFLTKKTADVTTLPALTIFVKQTLNADLPAVFAALMQKLENLAALATDVYHLMDALPPLVQVLRYGDTRGTDVSAVAQVVQHLVPRICIGFPPAVVNLDEDASKEAYEKMLAVGRALGMLNRPGFNEQWHAALQLVSESPNTNGILTGAATRTLFDKKIYPENQTATRMRYALSRGNEPLAAAQWLEGFLQGSGLLLLHNPSLWNLLDGWVAELGADNFKDVLPMLRRTFSRFPGPERERMLTLAKEGQVAVVRQSAGPGDYDEERARVVLGTVRLLLGVEG